MMPQGFPVCARRAAMLAALIALAACSAVPASGPTTGEFNDALSDNNPLGLKIVELTPPVLETIARDPGHPPPEPALGATGQSGRLGVGDILQITVFETGSGLFNASAQNSQIPDSAAVGTPLPPLQVGDDGSIRVPYVGRVQASGLTPTELKDRIEAGLKSKSMEPQVVVAVVTNVANTVIVSGDVHAPGRYSLSLQPEHLMDIIAIAGGSNNPGSDEVIELTRGNQRFEVTQSEVETLGTRNIQLAPGDRVRLMFRPRTYTVFGAAGRLSELPLTTETVSLAQGLSRAAGLTDSQSDPEGVYLFRFEHPAVGKELGLTSALPQGYPVIYRVNLMDPTGYIMLKQFQIRDKDLIFVANARSLRIQKLLGVLSNLFAPLASTRTIAQ
jgi:polysaccharide export outer membrane protein